MSGDERAYLFYLLILLFFIGGGFLYGRREKLGKTLQQAAIWILIFIGVIIAYGFSDTLRQQITPSRVVQNGENYEARRSRDGHFYLTLKINGRDLQFVVDTGATAIVLSKEDAARVGIDVKALAYLGRAETANGIVRTAPVVLKEIILGDLRDVNVRAYVNEGDLFGSLLGMDYLRRFSEISMRGDKLILKP